MVRWEYLRCWSPSSNSRRILWVGSSEQLATTQYLSKVFPQSKSKVVKDGSIFVDNVFFPPDFLDALGEIGWELVGFEGLDYVFKRPRGGE
ncbi:MAG: hypothetical protein Q7O66_15180 [Dehalococcoidia bacterium]|nr:hypothetical protein [Dehalococcoidia bacterium]